VGTDTLNIHTRAHACAQTASCDGSHKKHYDRECERRGMGLSNSSWSDGIKVEKDRLYLALKSGVSLHIFKGIKFKSLEALFTVKVFSTSLCRTMNVSVASDTGSGSPNSN
jgi:hypothetical protein